jgi:glutaredoxin
MKLLLYGTLSCHLCEQAEAVLHAAGVTAEYTDIAEDEALLEKYGMRSPVVRRVDNGTELGWPFDIAALGHLTA